MITSETPSILIVDDDPTCVFLAQTVLENHFRVSSVSNGHAALELMKQEKFDLVLMDINLGDERMDGIRTMRMIKQERRHKRVKVMAVTVFAHQKEWFTRQGFDNVFTKPVIEEKILEVINETLNSMSYSYI